MGQSGAFPELVQILRVKTSELSSVLSVLKPGIEVTKLCKDRKDNIVPGKSPAMLFRFSPRSCFDIRHTRSRTFFLIFREIAGGCVPSVNGESLFFDFLKSHPIDRHVTGFTCFAAPQWRRTDRFIK